MDHAVIFDCEFLTAPGAPQRFWCGPHDPDPVIAQIGAVKLSLGPEAEIVGRFGVLVRPVDRNGRDHALDPLFTRLTGITQEAAAEGLELGAALARLETFAEGAKLWSWGKDEFNMLAISCYVAGIAPPIPATRFDNACKLMLKAGMSLDDLHQTRSNDLADRLGVAHPPLRAHDAVDDALSVAYAVQHFLRSGALAPDDLR